MRRATTANTGATKSDPISIHALLAESDLYILSVKSPIFQISIHALLAESDLSLLRSVMFMALFLSTLSLRRATYQHHWRGQKGRISIHALLAESDVKRTSGQLAKIVISIHALLAESDKNATRQVTQTCYFYPRSPCGERPVAASTSDVSANISIHALLAESDASHLSKFDTSQRVFLSTLSLRRATWRL